MTAFATFHVLFGLQCNMQLITNASFWRPKVHSQQHVAMSCLRSKDLAMIHCQSLLMSWLRHEITALWAGNDKSHGQSHWPHLGPTRPFASCCHIQRSKQRSKRRGLNPLDQVSLHLVTLHLTHVFREVSTPHDGSSLTKRLLN